MQNLLGNYIKFLVKNPKITRKIAVFTRAAIRSPKIEKILFSRIQPSETLGLDYESFSTFRPRKWRVRNWRSKPVVKTIDILLKKLYRREIRHAHISKVLLLQIRSRASSKSFPRIQISPNPKVAREFRDFS